MFFLRLVHHFIFGVQSTIIAVAHLIKWFILGVFTVILVFPYYFIIGIICIFNKKKRKEIGFKKPLIPTIIMILSLTTYFISIFIFTRWFVQNERIKKMSESIIEATIILQEEEEQNGGALDDPNDNSSYSDYSYLGSIDADFNTLLSINSDIVAWIKVNGTYINYPVVQSSDNEYYLNHDINKYSTNVGWIFGDYRDNFDTFGRNTIIYGHNLTNKTMFGSLPWVLRSSWYKNEENYNIQMATVSSKLVWKVFSVYKIDPVTDYLRTSFYSTNDYQEWLDLITGRSVYDFGVDVGTDDKILTLSTCDDTGNYRVVLHAKLVSMINK